MRFWLTSPLVAAGLLLMAAAPPPPPNLNDMALAAASAVAAHPMPNLALADHHAVLEGRDLAPLAVIRQTDSLPFMAPGQTKPVTLWTLWLLYRLNGRYVLKNADSSRETWADTAGCPALTERVAALATLAPDEHQLPPLDGPAFQINFDPAFNPRPPARLGGLSGSPLGEWLIPARKALAGCWAATPALAKKAR